MENTKKIGSKPYLIPARVIFIHELLKPSFILLGNAFSNILALELFVKTIYYFDQIRINNNYDAYIFFCINSLMVTRNKTKSCYK